MQPEVMYLCTACGKLSPTKTGEGGDKHWDVSCFMNAIAIPREAIRMIEGERMIDWSKINLAPHEEAG